MPIEWLYILSHEKIPNKSQTLLSLKYDMTIDDMYDLQEYLSYEDWKSEETRFLQEEANRKAENR